MKVVGTKLDNSDYEIFYFMCQDCGLSKSEMLRDFVKSFIRTGDKPGERETVEIKERDIPRVSSEITKISYDGGKTWEDVAEMKDVRVVEN